ncbi:MAG: tyrosine--tRNA ligase [bacterium]|nr:tyrosine--tRNA ligase [bacterium]
MDVNKQLEIIKRGAEEIISKEELLKKLELCRKEKRPLKVKFGADPTAPDIHLGHTVVLRKLRQFQDLGHKIIFLIGDFTAMIGDPSGRSVTRPPMSKEDVENNSKTYVKQIGRILDLDKVEIVYNSHWLNQMNFSDVIKLASHYTVARVLERDDFSNRYKKEEPIGIHEFLYPLAQGYDSVELKADIEIGGTDQKFNLLVGRALQKEYGQESQVVLTMPLLEGTDGVRKMSKSYGNYIGINEPPREIYGKLMSVSDEMMMKYYKLLTDVPEEELNELKSQMKEGAINPKFVKSRLAKLIITDYYPKEEADNAEREFNEIFSKKGQPDEIPEFIISSSSSSSRCSLGEIMVQNELVSSKGEARRLIEQGGVSIDGIKVSEDKYDFGNKKESLLKVGKRKFLKLIKKD